ncbi:MAG: tetratricopeptide repeat protein [Candidatus Kapabacteria bacterium]|nr:tetratricopeptide repeat protein [Candidatus Kapabacteria bacterium]
MTLNELIEKNNIALKEQLQGNLDNSNLLLDEIFQNSSFINSMDSTIAFHLVDSYLIKGWNHALFGKNELAIDFCTHALNLAEKYSIVPKIAKANNILGNSFNIAGKYDMAVECYSLALVVFEKINDTIGIGSTYNNLGMICQSLSDNEKALNYFTNALSLFESLQEKRLIANVYNNLGTIYQRLNNHLNGLEYYKKAQQFYDDISDKVGLANSTLNVGNVYLSVQHYESAIECFKKAMQLFDQIGFLQAVSHSIFNLGLVYTELLNYEKALECYLQALSKYQNLQDEQGEALSLIGIGTIYSKPNFEFYNSETAEENLKNGLSISERIQFKLGVKDAYLQLSVLYEHEKKFEKSLDYFKESVKLENEILTEEAVNKAQLFDQRRKLEEDEKARQLKLARFQEQEKILHNILPSKIADRILSQESFISDHFESVSVLFMDLVGFTTLSSIAPPKQLVFLLDTIFTKADEIIEQFGLEKIKTIGDGYLAVANVTSPLENHQNASAQAALQLLETMRDFTANIPSDLGDTAWIKDINDIEIRIGIHTGEVVAGIIGKNKYTYDLWGDAVNVASRMESHSEAGRIHISEEFAKSIKNNEEFEVIPRGEINIKGKGLMNTFWLEKRK